MAARQLSDGRAEGQTLGQSSTDKISVYNATPIVRQTKAVAVTTTAANSTANNYGYATAAQADAIVTAINALIVIGTNFGVTD